jgi:hypothetical protein
MWSEPADNAGTGAAKSFIFAPVRNFSSPVVKKNVIGG